MINNKNFCIQPWIHLATWNDGKVPLCCVAEPEVGLNLNNQSPIEVWNSVQFRTARLKFMNGERLPQCGSCWKEEDSGIKSHRQIENDIWQKKLSTEYLENIISSTDSDGSLSHRPITLDLRLGNTCNLQCVMCRPRDSSKWLQDSKKLASILISKDAKADWTYKANSISSTDCFDWFANLETQNALDEFLSDIKHIIFGGGEPLLIKEHESFIERLVESGYSNNIELRYHTNGTVLNSKLLNLWEKFKGVELMVSIDDWGIRNNYVRYPSNWNTVSNNLDTLDSTGDNITVNILSTIHAMNIYNLPDFVTQLLAKNYKKICQKNQSIMSVGTTHWPQYMSTRVLPARIKAAIVDYWNKFTDLDNNARWKTRIKYQLDFMLNLDESHRFGDLMDYIEKLDSIRPIKFATLYPEYYNLLLTEKNNAIV